MIRAILNFFGYTIISQSELEEKNNRISELEKTIQNNHDFLFNFNCFKPELKYDEFCEKNNLPKERNHSHKYWNQYWDDQYAAHHIAVHLRKLSLHPKLLRAFLVEFGSYDWKSRAEFMKKVNWTYAGSKETPTIKELQHTVFSLIPEGDFDHPNNTIQSGGFEVTINYIDGEPNCKIFFRESDVRYVS